MSRYLTADKIGVLNVVILYCDCYVPKEGTIPVLSFITSRLVPNTTDTHLQGAKSSAHVSTTLDDIKELLQALNREPDAHSLWDDFLHNLWRLKSLDAMFDFFRSLPLLLCVRAFPDNAHRHSRAHPIVPSATSLIGTFLRRAVLEFERLSFEDTISLWQNFELFRRPTLQTHPSLGRLADDKDGQVGFWDEAADESISAILEKNLHISDSGAPATSSYDVEKLMTFQIDKIQKYGNRLPAEIQDQLHGLSNSSREGARLSNYLSFLDSWYSGDYPSSFENLHRYYDYAMNNKDRSHYQYALLNMAILQADFGCYSEAMAAMDEAIGTARENKDMSCLNFCLSWLYHFRTIHGREIEGGSAGSLLGPDNESLAFLKSKTQDGKLPNIHSTTLLNEARLSLAKGQGPQIAFERVYEASHLNLTYDLKSLEGSKLLVQSSIFGRLGITTLSSSYCNLLIDCYKATTPSDELMRARCRIALTAVLAGDYSAAVKSLDALGPDVHRNLVLHQFVCSCVGMFKLKKSLHNNDLRTAGNLLPNLKVAPRSDPELSFQINMLEIEYLHRTLNYSEALTRIEELASQTEKDGSDVSHRLRLLTAKALHFHKCRRPQKGLSLALRATTAAYRARIMPALWEATGALALAMVGIEQFDYAGELLDAVIYQASETEDAALMALLQSTRADAAVGKAGTLREQVEERDELLRTSLHWLREARTSYERLEDILGKNEMDQKVAMINRMGVTVDVNK